MSSGSNLTSRERQDAPPALEPVRLFLQTWRIANDTRVPFDELTSLEAVGRLHERHFPALASPPKNAKELATLRAVRDDLRHSLEVDEAAGLDVLKRWFDRFPVVAEVCSNQSEARVRYRYRGSRDAMAGAVLALLVDAIADGSWRRLKICPDCRSVFYDRTKPKNRVWCGMSAHSPGGRACGNIAKVRNWRERQKSSRRAT